MTHLDFAPSWTAKPPRWAIALALGLLVFLLMGLGRPPLFDVDEGAFSKQPGACCHQVIGATPRSMVWTALTNRLVSIGCKPSAGSCWGRPNWPCDCPPLWPPG